MSGRLTWERLPLLALIFFFFSSVRLAGKHLYQAVPVLAGLFIAVDRVRDFIPHILVGFLVLLLITTVLRYRRFFFVTEEGRIRVRQGVFRKVELNLDYDRIQQADVEQPAYFRPFGLAVLKLQSAGSKAQEVEVAGIRSARAQQVQRDILAEQQAAATAHVDVERSADTALSSVTPEQADFGFTLRNAEVLRIGLMQNVFVVVGVLATLLFSNPYVGQRVRDRIETVFEQFPSTAEAVLVVGSVTLFALVIFVLGTVLFYFNQYYGYRLVRQGDRVRYQAGFTSTLSRSFRVQKLQQVDIRQSWMGRLLQRFQIRISQAGGHAQKQDGKFTIPCAHQALLEDIRSDLRLTSPQWQSVHWSYFPQHVALLTLVAGLFFGVWVALGVFVFLLVVRLRWWRRFAYHFDGLWLALRHGFIGQREMWMPAAKMQAVTRTQGPLQRVLGVANLHISSAAGVLHIASVPLEEAKALQAQLLDVTRSDYRRWM
ncbi:PH domain-containing protein [Aliidiomarina sanyensis]|uniref:YdbS-like PH domain-containing protein n=1 Tax=Aliidiomarina sanyensis TaxID=1249555 RepID=A0A432WKJ0_9GAMM|nr:PH domain-containing protein [Aliidiomarina sanyensis]RUO34217.1 hypothetical protein CWE11_05675 [Aliidiomarina sanyensis]